MYLSIIVANHFPLRGVRILAMCCLLFISSVFGLLQCWDTTTMWTQKQLIIIYQVLVRSNCNDCNKNLNNAYRRHFSSDNTYIWHLSLFVLIRADTLITRLAVNAFFQHSTTPIAESIVSFVVKQHRETSSQSRTLFECQ